MKISLAQKDKLGTCLALSCWHTSDLHWPEVRLLLTSFFLHLFRKRIFGDKWHKFFMVQMSFLLPDSVKAVKETEVDT